MRREQDPPSYEEEVAGDVHHKMRQRGLRDEVIEFCQKYWVPTLRRPSPIDYVQALEEAGRVPEGIGVLQAMLPYLLPSTAPCRPAAASSGKQVPGPEALMVDSSDCQSGRFPYHHFRNRVLEEKTCRSYL